MTLSFFRRTLFLLFAVLLTASLALAGCGGDDPPPTTSAPPTTTGPSGPIAFTGGKYQHQTTYNEVITVATSNDDGTISVGIKARTTGWIAIALSPTSQKAGADLWMFTVDSNGNVTAVDSYNPGFSGSHPPDTGGKNDLFDVTGNEINGVTTIEFKRDLNTLDSNDVRILNGLNSFIWAIGPSDNTFEEHVFFGFGDITVSIEHP
jgi:predicted small lipoprotein YifL